ncbi:PadR family transcriptional regulator [Actinoallomurus sp. NPDC050550]|uniref:PadR family transcriptional regulator n=1 Tax=Actinoallomurus sp. NPDC050550 TaxID=3154937 RepID=UPI003405D9C4
MRRGSRHREERAAFGDWGPGFGPGFGPRGRGGRGGRRMKRGNVRAAILALLAERPMHGYEMIQELANRTGGIWRPSPGSVYPTLQLLEDEGLISGQESSGKKLFALTDEGRGEAESAGRTPPWAEVTEDAGAAATHVHTAMGQLMMAIRQVMHAGNEDQRERALDVINDARRRLYGILADDGD